MCPSFKWLIILSVSWSQPLSFLTIKVHTTPLLILLLQQWDVLIFLLVPCCLEGSASVFICHGDVYDGHILAGFIYCDGLRLEGLIQARNCLVESNGGRCRSMKYLHRVTMTLCYGK